MRRCIDVLLLLGLFPLFLIADFPKEDTPLLTSSVRIIEGVVATDWELCFLPRESADNRAVSPQPSPAPSEHKSPTPRMGVSRNGKVPVAPRPKKPRTDNHLPAAPGTTAEPPKSEPPKAESPRSSEKPSPSVPYTSSVSPKIDKEPKVNDDSGEKRKKERREILREERKERDYRNRRIE